MKLSLSSLKCVKITNLPDKRPDSRFKLGGDKDERQLSERWGVLILSANCENSTEKSEKRARKQKKKQSKSEKTDEGYDAVTKPASMILSRSRAWLRRPPDCWTQSASLFYDKHSEKETECVSPMWSRSLSVPSDRSVLSSASLFRGLTTRLMCRESRGRKAERLRVFIISIFFKEARGHENVNANK